MPNVGVFSKPSKPSALSAADLEAIKKILKGKEAIVDAVMLEGGPGSGHWGHAGRKGQVGGSRTSGVGGGLDFDKTSPGERMRMANYGDISRQISTNLAGIRVGKARYTEVQGNVTVGVARTIGKNMKAELSTYTNYLAGETVDLAHRYISMTEQTIERNTGSFRGVDAEVLNKLGVDCVKKLVHQEIESNRQQFTDHGIRHVVKNTMDQSAMLDQMARGGVKVSARERLMANFVMVNHDIGYTTPMIRSGGMNAIKGAKEHPAYSKRIAGQQEGKWNVGKVFSKKEYARALNIIGTHDATTLDMGDSVATATRIADNLSLFQKEKLPSMFRYVSGSERTLVAMGIAARKKDTKAFEKYRDQLYGRIEGSDRLSGNLKRDLKRAVAEISYVTPKFTLGVLAGEVSKIGSSANAVVSVTVKHNKFDSTLQKMFDMGQKQTKKFLEDYGRKDFNKKSYLLGSYKGKAILELKVEGVSPGGLKEAIESIKGEILFEVGQ